MAMAYTSSVPSYSHRTAAAKQAPPGCDIAFVQPSVDGGQFAFARIKGEVCLVQVALTRPGTTASALTTVDVKIFRHEFITIFRLSHSTTIHPSDLRILEPIDEEVLKYEEESETVFLAKDLVEQLRRMTDRRGLNQHRRLPQMGRRR